MADGGEGTLDVLGGPNRTSTVTGPLGTRVEAAWRLDGRTAVIEMAQGLGVGAGGRGGGERSRGGVDGGDGRADRRGDRQGGASGSSSASVARRRPTAGWPPCGRSTRSARLKGVDLIVACDTRVAFLEAATSFAPQKGATTAQVELLRRRLERLAQVYRADHGVDVLTLEGAGAAGGLAGGLAAAGARLVSGFDLVADEVHLDERLEGADLVVTAEGFLDALSFEGKVVGGVVGLAGALGVPVVAIAGQVFDDAGERVEAISLVDRFGEERARADTLDCIREVMDDVLAGHEA